MAHKVYGVRDWMSNYANSGMCATEKHQVTLCPNAREQQPRHTDVAQQAGHSMRAVTG